MQGKVNSGLTFASYVRRPPLATDRQPGFDSEIMRILPCHFHAWERSFLTYRVEAKAQFIDGFIVEGIHCASPSLSATRNG
ncbi:hypothetical protein [Variovorax sp. Varisp36]|uniref:hypothetical protein n=1 Tax=Variovorax sp. Varisp36 TaxID=3243031 RepID=UPI0039A4BA48